MALDGSLKDMSFEDLMAELKKTLDVLEKGDQSLENSMKSYETGVTLVRLLEEKLKNMEGRMEEILADGTIKNLEIEVGTADESKRI
ncbi:MAG TPA: exodeoxyribonuclease VII small subunit [Myxococcota bacterium]|nr:exodeoxyribonuclease VII small subunit [Myxococcota bacterium]